MVRDLVVYVVVQEGVEFTHVKVHQTGLAGFQAAIILLVKSLVVLIEQYCFVLQNFDRIYVNMATEVRQVHVLDNFPEMLGSLGSKSADVSEQFLA